MVAPREQQATAGRSRRRVISAQQCTAAHGALVGPLRAVQGESAAAAAVPAAESRRIVIAVDDTDDAQQAVEWAVRNVLRYGDVLHLLHVLRDNRTNETDVGQLSRAGASWATPDYRERQAWFARLTDAANAMISRRFINILKKHHVEYQIDLLRQKGTFSAAGIGELICESAAKLDAELMMIASHGVGVLAEFGSVAKYCQDNSPAPVLMLPPNLAAAKPSIPGQVLVVAFKDSAAVERAVTFASQNVLSSGDAVTLLFVQEGDEEVEVEVAAKAVLAGADVDMPIKLEVDCIRPLGPLETSDIDVGAVICEIAEDVGARIVVMLSRPRSQNLMQNMLFGSSVTYCVRHCKSPLLIIK